MREILFRGKELYGDRWIEGSLLVFPNTKRAKILKWNNSDLEFDEIEVIPETVGQCTGFNDANGTKIFEGDIVETQERYDRPYSDKRKSKRHIGVVEYKVRGGSGFYNGETGEWNRYVEYEAEWIVHVDDYGKFVHGSWGDFFDCEVIGNIHDNPKRMKDR